jgi:WD40 repeat protein
VIDTFGNGRLLTFDHDPLTRGSTVEVAHEALLKEWPRLRTWLDESRADIRMQRNLARAAREWLEAEHEPSFLMIGSRLAQFEGWVETSAVSLTADENSFLEASLDAKLERETAERERRQRELEQISIGLASQASQELDGPFPERSVLLALEALENYPYSWQAERALGQAVLGDRLCMRLSHDDDVNTASWSQDGTQILTASDDKTVRLWDVCSGEELWRISEGRPDLASWSPDYKSILVINGIDDIINMWDFDSHAERFSLNLEDLKGNLYFNTNYWNPWSPSSEYFLIYTIQGTVYVFDTSTGNLLHTLSNHQGSVTQALCSPNGELIATSGGEDSKIILWEAETGKAQYTLDAGFEDERAMFANWSPSGDRFATRGLGGVKIYDTATGTQLLDIQIPQVWIMRVSWSPDEALVLIAGTHDGIARVWDVESGTELSIIEGLVQAFGSDWSPSGDCAVVSGADGCVHVWGRTASRELEKIRTTSSYFTHIKLSPDGKYILAFGGDNTFNILKLSEADKSFHNESHGNLTNAAWSPDGGRFAFGILVPPDSPIKIWDSMTFDKILVLSGYGDGPVYIYWSPSGDRILITCHNEAHVWDAATGKQIIKLKSHTDEIRPADWSPDGKLVATGSEDGEIIIWDPSSGEISLNYSGHQDRVRSLNWSPDGTRILSTSQAGEATIWDAATGRVLIELLPEDYINLVPDANWSHDGQRVFILTAEGEVHIFNAHTGTKISQFSTFPVHLFTRFSLSPSEERILIEGLDGTAKVWNIATGAELISYEVGGFVKASYSPDGKRVLIGTTEGKYGKWQVFPTWQSTHELIDYAKKHKVFRQLTAEERDLFGLPA